MLILSDVDRYCPHDSKIALGILAFYAFHVNITRRSIFFLQLQFLRLDSLGVKNLFLMHIKYILRIRNNK